MVRTRALEDGLLEALASALPDCLVRDALQQLASLPIEAPLAEAVARSGTSGFVAESVPLASFAAQRAGAALGGAAIPAADWERGAEREEVRELAERFARWVGEEAGRA